LTAEPTTTPQPLRSAWGPWGLALLLACYAALAFDGARQKSVTVDELGHLPAGLLYLETGDPRYASLNPPLVNVLSALPVLLLDLETERERPAASDDPQSFWSTGYHFMEQHRTDYLRIYAVARAAPIVLVALLGVLLFSWGRALVPAAPDAAGLLAAGLVLLSPNVLAQARLVGTDTGTACFVLLALFAFRRMLLRPTGATVILAGVTLGLAQLAKLYALLLYPTLLLLVLAWPRLSPEPRPPHGRLLGAFGLAALVSLLVLNAGYLGSELGASLSELTLGSEALRSWQSSWLGRVPLPLPGAYLRAADGQLLEVASGIPSFLLGERFQGGRWWFYLALLAIKTPPPLLALSAAALVVGIARRPLPARELAVLLAYPTVLFVFLSLGDRRQLGARALLSAVPLVQLAVAATLAAALPRRRAAALSAAALAALAVVSVRAHPHPLAYFNAFVGGSEQGWRHASDANLDIGQDLVALKAYLEEQGIDRIQLLYFGSVDPALYGIDYVVPKAGEVAPGPLAVSVSLYRMGYPTYDHGRLTAVGPVSLPLEPVASLGGSLHVYEIPPGR